MKISNTKLKKTLLIIGSTIIITVIVVIACISPITKYLVEKYDEKYMGRQITMSWAYVNPFTGYVYFHNLKIYEYHSDSIMLSADGAGGDFSLKKLFYKTYEIKELVLNRPIGIVIQQDSIFNFTDLIEKFSSNEIPDSTTEPLHFNIRHIKINDGLLYYRDVIIPVNYFVKKLNIESDGLLWDADTVVFKFSFLSGPSSGSVNGNMTVNFKTLDYHYDIEASDFDLHPVEQYIKDFANYGSFAAMVDGNLKAYGNFNDGEDVTAKGLIAFSDFHFGKNKKEDYASFDKLIFAINDLSPKKHKYIFDSVSLSHPFFLYEQYDYLDNIETVFGKGGENIYAANGESAKYNLVVEVARYVQILARNFFQSYYKVNRLAVYNGNFGFNDYSLSEKFSLSANPFNMVADSIDKNHDRVKIHFQTGILPYGNATVTLDINPVDTADFNLQYHLQKLPAALFNPYFVSYTSFPLDRGTFELNGNWQVRNDKIESENHLLIIDPRLSERIKNKEAMHLPMPLIMFFIRERGNVIDYEIPITGDLKNPKFHLRDVIFDLLKNVFVKPPSIPYRRVVKKAENEIEKIHTIQWQMRQNVLEHNPEEFVNKIVDFLAKNPEASITVHPMVFAEKEKEYILFYEAKKKYYLSREKIVNENFSEADSTVIDKMSIKDSLFVKWLNKQVTDTLVFTVQEKCRKIISSTTVNNKFSQLNKQRENAFSFYFVKAGVEKQIKISPDETTVPYNGFTFYRIEYTGGIPESLTKAYEKMNQFNNEPPRLQFMKQREKTKNSL